MKQWQAARDHCRGLGGYLARITSAGVNDFLRRQLNSRGAWFHLTDSEKEGLWSDGTTTTVTYTNWAASEPNNAGGSENCAAIMGIGQWTDQNCGMPKTFICARGRESSPNTPAGTVKDQTENTPDVQHGSSSDRAPAQTTDQTQDRPNNQQGSSTAQPGSTAGQTQTRPNSQRRCPAGWATLEGQCYKSVPIKRNWDEARQYCRILGADLARIPSAQVNTALSKWIPEKAWFYLNDKEQEGRFTDGTAGPVEYTNWRKGEPSGASEDEDCAELLPDERAGLWNDMSCATENYIICGKAPSVEMADQDASNNQGCPLNWSFYGGKCYRADQVGLTWYEASVHCRLIGGGLARITSEGINQHLSEISTKGAWFYLSDTAQEGRFVDGTVGPLQYENWNAGEPNDAGDNEDCAALMVHIAKWNDANCGVRLGVLCEKAPVNQVIGTDMDDNHNTQASRLGCTLPWRAFRNSCFGFINAPRTWQKGQAYCKERGGDLAKITSEEINSFLSPMVLSRAWFFTNDRETEGRFVPQPLRYSNWESGEPNDRMENEDCGELMRGAGRWNDRNCDHPGPFICEIKKSCPSRDWTMFVDGVCYLASDQRVTWEEGRTICREKGADYARIRSEELNSFLAGLIHERTWILLHDRRIEGTFEYERGQPLSYTKWRPGEPNNMFGEDCVFMHSDTAYMGFGGTWVDADCNERRNLLCAKEASFNPSLPLTEDTTDPDSPVNSNPSDTEDLETPGYPDDPSTTDDEEEESIGETSPVSPEDEPCAPKGQNCIDEFRQKVELAQTDPFRNLKDICRGVETTSTCVRQSLQHCVEEVRGQVQEAFDRQMADITRNCPGDCELQRGETCTRNLSRNIATTLLAQDGTCDKVQRHVDEARACVHKHVTSCGQEERRVYDDAIKLMQTEGKKACAVPTVTPPSKPPGIRCLTCDKSSKEDCRNNGETVFCPQDKQRCITITYPSHTSPKLQKRCGSPASCGTTPTGGPPPLCCSTDLCNDFSDRGPPKKWVPPSEPDSCDSEAASTCLHELTADTVSEVLRGDDADWSDLCRTTLTQKKGCISTSVSTCWQSTQERFDRATLFVEGIFGDCTDATNPGICNMEHANECIESFRETVNAYGGTYRSCGSFTPTIDCVNGNIRGCGREDRESMNEHLTAFLKTSRRVCRPVLEMTSSDTMTIVEGGDPGIIKYRINHPATMICRQPNCKVYIHLELEDGIWPRCWKDRRIIKQAVFGILEPKSSDTCGDLVTNANYQQERHVPVAAKLDFKYDGPQTRDVRVVLKHMINGQEVLARVLSRVKLTIQERDIKGLCKSVNDPHMTTFNGRYYNNHKEGKFILYKSTRYPYEVQTIYQRCSARKRVTCNCAVAIRSGDTVFVVDRCRRMSLRSSAMKTYIHQHDRITPGTRFFRLHGGRRYHVVLPHGTMVKVTASGLLINVFVVASPADYKSTQGLCGFYDEGKHNDFKMRNGDIYNGPGSQHGGQPDRFSEEWRVRTGEDIFRGVAKAPFNPTKYCSCGTENGKCCSSNLLELCDTDTSGEITKLLQAGTVTQPAPRSRHGWFRGRRSTNDDDDEDDIEFSDDDDTQPLNVTWPVNGWTEESARKFCRDYIFRKNKAGARCLQVNQMELATFDMENDVNACVEDIKATGNTTWASAALDSMQATCQVAIERETKVADSTEGRQVAQNILEETCMNQCNDQGQCINGSCDCEEGWAGEDCSIRTDAVPEELTMPGYGLCDLRQRECTDGIVFGVNFINTSSLTCHLQEVSITGDQVGMVRGNMTVTAEYFSFNQVRCPLPRPASYYVAVSNNGQQPSPAHLMVTHDSACYQCDPTGPKCIRKPQDNCVIKGKCYDDGENNPDNNCLVCRSSESNSDWHWETACGLSPGWKAGIITGVIAAVATTVTLTVLLKMKKKNKLFVSNFSLDEIPKLTKVK